MAPSTPTLDPRHAAAVVEELLTRLPAYVPELSGAPGGPGWAVLQVLGRYAQILTERLNQAPDKNKLAFLDLMGINLLPAQAARAPVVFQALPNVGDGHLPARTRVGAKIADRSDPLVFETEQAIALAAATLSEVVTVYPARDSYADHSQAVLKNEAFTLFKPLQPIRHELYLAHETHLALAGKATVALEFDLAVRGAQGLDIAWEFWNGEIWQSLVVESDGTAGLRRSGVVLLSTDCGAAARTTVNGIMAYWLRGVLTIPLPPEPGVALAGVNRLRLSTTIARPILAGSPDEIQLDRALSDGTKLDVTKTFFPLGRNPDQNSAFYFSSDEVFSKLGAGAQLRVKWVETPEEKADKLAADKLAAQALDLEAKSAARAGDLAYKVANALRYLAIEVGGFAADEEAVLNLQAQIQALHQAVTNVQNLTGMQSLEVQLFATVASMNPLTGGGTGVLPSTVPPYKAAMDAGIPVIESLKDLGQLIADTHATTVLGAARSAAQVVANLGQGLVNALQEMVGFLGSTDGTVGFRQALEEKVSTLNTALNELVEIASIESLSPLAKDVASAAADVFVASQITPSHFDYQTLYSMLIGTESIVITILTVLIQLAQLKGSGTVDENAPTLEPPRLIWEYWNGTAWKVLHNKSGQLGPVDDKPTNFVDSGMISFTIPLDFEPCAVNSEMARWIRVRLYSGSFNQLRYVSWKDQVSNSVTSMAILQPRPPALEGISLGYEYQSPKSAAEHCVTLNDFAWEDHTSAAQWSGAPFAPYRPTSDRTPALYLGFDRALPADLLGLYLNIIEHPDQPEGQALQWEYWDGSAWQALRVRDETRRLALPGMVTAVWPGVETSPTITVVQASGTRVHLADARHAVLFTAGDVLYITQNGAGELATVMSVTHDIFTLKTPLSQDYTNATMSLATLARFGTPRTWVRARLDVDEEPLTSRVLGIYLNAIWATNLQTVENETFGSSKGQPDQVFFFRQTPVVEGETFEVRELDGPRAAVELPMLREELLQNGLTDADIRLVKDARTGKTTEVWVRWRVLPNLLFSESTDRDATIERTRGRLILGDDRHGRVPTVGTDNIRAVQYRFGGGLIGNVSAGKLTQLLSGVPAQSVHNPRAAEGGADGETIERVLRRGPRVIRHRYRAVSRDDYEDLAREASPGVAAARALPATHPNGRPAPGWVTVIIVPQSQDAQPQPSFALRRHVQEYLVARAPASVAGVAVVGPAYLPVGIDAMVTPLDPQDARAVTERTQAALAMFLHPLTGGPEGEGWPFGRSVYLSDVAAVVEAVSGVDYASHLELLLNDTPWGDSVEVPTDRIVVAGLLRVTLQGGEE